MERVLLVGATGYLGSRVLEQLIESDYDVTVFVRNRAKLEKLGYDLSGVKIKIGDLTEKRSVAGACQSIDTVISCVGRTQLGDRTDYTGNENLLSEAKEEGVGKFIYVAAVLIDGLKSNPIIQMREEFVKKVKESGMSYCIIRPNGFFSDLTYFYNKACSGKIYLFGGGKAKINPIAGEDLATQCIARIKGNETEFPIGGPEIYSYRELAELAFEVVGKKPEFGNIPGWLVKLADRVAKILAPKKSARLDFLVTIMTTDVVAPKYGTHTVKSHFEKLCNASKL